MHRISVLFAFLLFSSFSVVLGSSFRAGGNFAAIPIRHVDEHLPFHFDEDYDSEEAQENEKSEEIDDIFAFEDEETIENGGEKEKPGWKSMSTQSAPVPIIQNDNEEIDIPAPSHSTSFGSYFKAKSMKDGAPPKRKFNRQLI